MTEVAPKPSIEAGAEAGVAKRIPPHAFFLVSAIFHYLGPAFAVLLFKHVAVLGVAWLRIGSAAAIFVGCGGHWDSEPSKCSGAPRGGRRRLPPYPGPPGR